MPELGERFDQALVYASRLHRGQVRKQSTVPYVSHLLGVASLALEHGGDEDEAIAALLHDAVEDQGGETTLAEIRKRFGDRVAEIVAACSDSMGEPKPPWRERKEAYIARLKTASRSARLVSAADKLHNARSILTDYRREGARAWNRFTAGRDGVLWYYRALVDALRPAGPSALVEELDRVVAELERLAVTETRRAWKR
jgi:(p)ppGpp synthase/HD superfamily hydrolase